MPRAKNSTPRRRGAEPQGAVWHASGDGGGKGVGSLFRIGGSGPNSFTGNRRKRLLTPFLPGRAFTLIEIMLVVVIIGTLAAIMVPRFAGKQQTALIAKTKAEIGSLSTVIDAFELDVGRFPTTEEGLRALVERPSGVEEEQWDGPYLRELKRDAWGNDYHYRHPGEFSVDYDLWSWGPDGRDGTVDDLRNVEAEKR